MGNYISKSPQSDTLLHITPRYMQAGEELMGKPLPVVSFNHPAGRPFCAKALSLQGG